MSIEFPKIENKSEQPLDFEQWLELELPKQYEEKVKILNKLGILEILPEAKEFGIVGIDGKEYPMPEMEEIKDSLEKNKECRRIQKNYCQHQGRNQPIVQAGPEFIIPG